MMEWISVKDKLPRNGEQVLTFNYDNFYHVAYFEGITDEFIDLQEYRSVNVTHWMPLPAPPKEEI